MSLLNDFLQGLKEGQAVWEQYKFPVKSGIENFNNTSKYTFISTHMVNNGYVDCLYPLLARDYESVGFIDVNDTFVTPKFLEILEESSRILEKEKEENKLSRKELVLLEFDLQEGIETLYKSLDETYMKRVCESIVSSNFISSRNRNPLYLFFYENSDKWLEEATATSGVTE